MRDFKQLFQAARSSEPYWIGRVKFQVAACLQDLLENANITQEKLAERIGVKAPQVSRALNGENNTTLETLTKMGFALGHVPHITFVPVDSKAEVFQPAFQLKTKVEKKRMVEDLYSFFEAKAEAFPNFADEVLSDGKTT